MSTPHPATTRSTAAAETAALARWLERAESTNVPVFSATVSEVTSIVDSSRSSAQDLAAAIGHDAALTAKLLKLANSPLFLQQGRSARTIGSAVVLLGFNAVRDLAITLSIIDRATRGPEFTPLLDTLLRAFHCAGQARAIALSGATEEPEELFLAGLLSRLGELVFWASQMPETDALAAHWTEQAPDEDCQKQILDFTLPQLTEALVRQWRLGSLLRAVVAQSEDDQRAGCVQLAHRIASAADVQRWQTMTAEELAESAELAQLVREHAQLLDQSEAMSLEQIRTQATEVNQIARRFGVTSTNPSPRKTNTAGGTADSDSTDSELETTNPARQLAVLGEMTTVMQGPATLDQLLRLALTGIVEGGGFDRVCFALLTQDRQALRAKHQLGAFENLPPLLPLASNQQLADALANPGPTLFEQSWILHGPPSWETPAQSLLQPVFAGTTAIGLLYADRAQNGPAIAAASVAALGLFVQHLALGLKSPG
ncbi:MAG: HDOD domain-containing protein [Pseudomonadales bacterium]